MAIDFGTALAGIGGIWQGALENKQEQEKQKQAQMLALQRLAIDQQNTDLSKQTAAQNQAHQLWTQNFQQQQAKETGQDTAYKEALQFPGMRLNEAQMTDMGAGAGTVRRGTMKPIGNPNDLAGTSIGGAMINPTAVSGNAQQPGMTQPGASQVAQTPNAPGFEIQEPFTEKIKRDQLDQAMKIQSMKDQRDRDLAAAKDDTERKKIDLMYAHTMAVLQSTQANQGINHAVQLQHGYEATTKPLADAISAYARMKEALPLLLDPNTPVANRAAAEAAIYEGNQKIVNPGVSVRGNQTKLYTDHQSMWQKFQGQLSNWAAGGQLAPDTVKAFMQTADQTIKPALEAYKGNRDRFAKQAHASQGVDADFVLGPDITASLNRAAAAPAPAAAPGGKNWTVGPDGKIVQQ
jgi:hypothetical protein